MAEIETIVVTVNGAECIRKDLVAAKPNGNCAAVVVDCSWAFAGDLTCENGRIKLSRTRHVFMWDSMTKKGEGDGNIGRSTTEGTGARA